MSSIVDALCLEPGGRKTGNSAVESKRFLSGRHECDLVDEETGVLQNLPPQLLKNYGALSELSTATTSIGTATTASSSSSFSSTPTISSSSYGFKTSSSLNNSFEAIPVPLKLRPFVKRLQDFASDDLSEQEIYSILFIIRLADTMLKVAYAAFLTQSFVDELKKKLGVEDLEVEIEIAATRWTYHQGAIMTYHRFSSDYDGSAMQQLSRIALGVLEDSITVTEGLKKIQACEERIEGSGPPFQGLERLYRKFPGRILVMPLLASTGAVVYFNANLVDFLVCWVTGTAAGLVQYICSKHSQLAGIEEITVAISTALLSTLSTMLFPGATCFPAQVLGTLFCFLYGISFVLSLYEITQNLVITGLTRFCLSIMRSFAMAFGVAIGLWAAEYGGQDRFDRITSSCTDHPYQFGTVWHSYFYPIMACGALMHLRVSPKHWPICLITQMLALKIQFFLSTVWKQPLFVANFIPAFVATLTAHILIVNLHRLNLTKLAIQPTAFLVKKLKRRKDIKEPLETNASPQSTQTLLWPPSSPASPNPNVLRFVDNGWADQGDTRQGYRRNDRFQYQRSDLWFCLMPALYLLVPGAAVWRVAFFSIIESSTQAGNNDAAAAAVHDANAASFQSLTTGIFVMGMGQVIGIRIALALLWAFTELWRKKTK